MINIQNMYVFSVHNLMSLDISTYLWWSCSFARSCPTLCDLMNCSTPDFPVLHCLLEFAQLVAIESVMPFNHFILWCPLLILPSILLSIRVFSSELTLHIRWPKYWSFSFSISPSNEYSGLIFFRIDWFDLLAVQGTLKSVLYHHSSKASIFWHSAFFIVSSYKYTWLLWWSGKWQPTPVFLLQKFHGQRSLVGYSPWGRKKLDMTEQTRTHILICEIITMIYIHIL